MRKILYQGTHITIRVWHILCFLLLLLLLLYVSFWHTKKEPQGMPKDSIIEDIPSDDNDDKKKAMEQVCQYSNKNMQDLKSLLDRSDFCSDIWFQDLDGYILRLEEQKDLMKDNDVMYTQQINLLTKLKELKKKQSETTIKALKETVNEYLGVSNKACAEVTK